MKTILNKTLFAIILSIMHFTTYAQISIGEIRSQMDSEKEDVFGIIRTGMACLCFGGVIYVGRALIMKKEASRDVVIGWLATMGIWGFAEALFG